MTKEDSPPLETNDGLTNAQVGHTVQTVGIVSGEKLELVQATVAWLKGFNILDQKDVTLSQLFTAEFLNRFLEIVIGSEHRIVDNNDGQCGIVNVVTGVVSQEKNLDDLMNIYNDIDTVDTSNDGRSAIVSRENTFKLPHDKIIASVASNKGRPFELFTDIIFIEIGDSALMKKYFQTLDINVLKTWTTSLQPGNYVGPPSPIRQVPSPQHVDGPQRISAPASPHKNSVFSLRYWNKTNDVPVANLFSLFKGENNHKSADNPLFEHTAVPPEPSTCISSDVSQLTIVELKLVIQQLYNWVCILLVFGIEGRRISWVNSQMLYLPLEQQKVIFKWCILEAGYGGDEFKDSQGWTAALTDIKLQGYSLHVECESADVFKKGGFLSMSSLKASPEVESASVFTTIKSKADTLNIDEFKEELKVQLEKEMEAKIAAEREHLKVKVRNEIEREVYESQKEAQKQFEKEARAALYDTITRELTQRFEMEFKEKSAEQVAKLKDLEMVQQQYENIKREYEARQAAQAETPLNPTAEKNDEKVDDKSCGEVHSVDETPVREKEVNDALVNELRETNFRLNKEVDELNLQRIALQDANNKLKMEVSKLKQSRGELDHVLEAHEADLVQKKQALDNLHATVKADKKEYMFLEGRFKQLEEVLETKMGDLNKVADENNALKQELVKVEGCAEELRGELEKKEMDLQGMSNRSEEMGMKLALYNSGMEEVARFQNEVKEMRVIVETIRGAFRSIIKCLKLEVCSTPEEMCQIVIEQIGQLVSERDVLKGEIVDVKSRFEKAEVETKNMAKRQHEKLQGDMQDALDKYARASKMLENTEIEVDEVLNAVNLKEMENEDLPVKLTAIADKLKNIHLKYTTRVSELKGKIEAREKEVETHKKEAEVLSKRKEELEKKVAAQEHENKEIRTNAEIMEEVRAQLGELEAKYSNMSREHTIASDKLTRVEIQLAASENEACVFRETSKSLESVVEKLTGDIERLEREKLDLEGKVSKSESQQNASEKVDELLVRYNQLELERRRLMGEVTQARAEAGRLCGIEQERETERAENSVLREQLMTQKQETNIALAQAQTQYELLRGELERLKKAGKNGRGVIRLNGVASEHQGTTQAPSGPQIEARILTEVLRLVGSGSHR